ncbi:hypothetical protein GXM21_12565 (plasmid) [Megamonas funiformis]|uniref:Uncharacterized protein n=1 Tax=Megamonas funiformis YIT 11815 TaxID=742816 RepID=A0ABN0EF45_9FIRM|nr:hypothetical protein [Megamonas funiformis]EHR31827.1 hypothetical protein HMPREF9454_02483 [Megamonas funiformis YIT 11815]QIB61255.1 hypothetical protein GXM21_12565 [Megamonas funiformis]
MLIHVRNAAHELQIKDILDINFDMKVELKDNKYIVCLNKQYTLDAEFNTKEEAEAAMIRIADSRNNLEIELKNW